MHARKKNVCFRILDPTRHVQPCMQLGTFHAHHNPITCLDAHRVSLLYTCAIVFVHHTAIHNNGGFKSLAEVCLHSKYSSWRTSL